ncbi:Speckle-type POZ protein B [Araneus ventricosus]|uniref:Speckle-type POZ protein B n=1 Tax=Araneus ventricosus TaxID=182803 RepID=A0A4Y2C493_ARAVE|nr:Speckle-type POZ protein B [Araneus ventricosus]
MSSHEETEQIDKSTLSASEFNSKSDGAVPNQKQPDPIDFLIVTRIPEKTYRFKWIIRQFSTLTTNKALYSTGIHALDNSWYRLKLVKYENGFGLFHVFKVQSSESNTARSQRHEWNTHTIQNSCSAPETSVRLTEQKEPKGAPNVNDFTLKLEYQISASDSREKDLMKWSVCFSDDRESQSYKIGEYMNNTSENFPDDTLILDCNLKVRFIPTTGEMPVASKPSLKSNSWKKLSTDFKVLYQNSPEADVTLVVGAEKIRAHKLILTVRSTVFKKIFYHDMEEAEQNSVAITDVQLPALQRLVEFLYTGIIEEGENKDMDLQELYDLYYAADKYEVMDLREMVGNTLLGRIQVDNASEILIWVDRHNDKDLKYKVMNFIRLNFETVSNTDTWESCSLHQPRLAAEVVNFCAKKLKTSEN